MKTIQFKLRERERGSQIVTGHSIKTRIKRKGKKTNIDIENMPFLKEQSIYTC